MRDRAIQFALGVFVSTFVYAMVVQRAITGSAGHHPFVPRIAVTGAFVLVLASVGLFIFYIHHVTKMIRVADIVAGVGAESRAVLERRYPADQRPSRPVPGLGVAVRTVAAPRPGVLVSVNEEALAHLAERAGCVIVLSARVGDYLPREHRSRPSTGRTAAGRASPQTSCCGKWPRTPSGPWSRIWRSGSASWWTSPNGPCHPVPMTRRRPARPLTCSMICCAACVPGTCPAVG